MGMGRKSDGNGIAAAWQRDGDLMSSGRMGWQWVPNLVEPGQSWPNSTNIGSNSTKLGRTQPKFGRSRPKLGPNRPKLAEFATDLVEVGPNSSEIDQSWPNRPKVGQNRIRERRGAAVGRRRYGNGTATARPWDGKKALESRRLLARRRGVVRALHNAFSKFLVRRG